MEDKKFNNYSLTDDEVSKILRDFESVIIEKGSSKGERDKDCEQEIRIQIYKALTKKRKKKK